MRALVVVDVQNDFIPGGALAVTDADQIIAPINAIMDDYDAVILTQDWHPADHFSFADNHEGATPFSVIDAPYGPQVLWPRHCVQGTKGAEFHPDLRSNRGETIIRKGFRSHIDSYSAFVENDKTTTTGLAGYANARGITALDFVGLATDYCVGWSAMDAAKNGFASRVILPLSRAIDLDGSLDAAIANMRAAGVIISETI